MFALPIILANWDDPNHKTNVLPYLHIKKIELTQFEDANPIDRGKVGIAHPTVLNEQMSGLISSLIRTFLIFFNPLMSFIKYLHITL